MFAEERRKRILDTLVRQGRVTVQELADQLQVSEDTIRRDLNHLSSHGYLQKTHGGAVMLDTPRLTYQQRSSVLNTNKVRIGEHAATRIQPEQSVFIDAGSTPLAAAQALLARGLALTVVTNSMEVVQVFLGAPEVELVVTGGIWNRKLAHFHGQSCIRTIQDHRFDVALLGVAALHPRAGSTTPYESDAQVKRAILQSSVCTMALADHTKMGLVSPYFVGAAQDLDVLVTDRPLPEFEGLIPEVLVVPEP